MNKNNKIDKTKVLVGSDFEMFIQNQDGKIVSAIPRMKGTKDKPEATTKEGCLTQHDGILAEVNVNPARLDDVDTFIDNVEFVKSFVKEHHLNKGEKLICCATGNLEDDELLDPEASQIGCSSDFNAWRDGDINEKPEVFPGNMRSAGCHYHFSYPDANVDISINLMKLFDLFITVPFVLLDTDRTRRELYGQAGAFRLQSWGEVQGFEARTLSSYCIDNSELVRYAFNQMNEMFDYYNSHSMKEIDGDAVDIVNCINNYDEELAKKLCNKYAINIPLCVKKEELEYDEY